MHQRDYYLVQLSRIRLRCARSGNRLRLSYRYACCRALLDRHCERVDYAAIPARQGEGYCGCSAHSRGGPARTSTDRRLAGSVRGSPDAPPQNSQGAVLDTADAHRCCPDRCGWRSSDFLTRRRLGWSNFIVYMLPVDVTASASNEGMAASANSNGGDERRFVGLCGSTSERSPRPLRTIQRSEAARLQPAQTPPLNRTASNHESSLIK